MTNMDQAAQDDDLRSSDQSDRDDAFHTTKHGGDDQDQNGVKEATPLPDAGALEPVDEAEGEGDEADESPADVGVGTGGSDDDASVGLPNER